MKRTLENTEIFIKCSNFIDTYSERIKNDNFENSKKHLEDFIDKVTHQLKKDNVNFPFLLIYTTIWGRFKTIHTKRFVVNENWPRKYSEVIF